jgi:NADPH-dependent 7-cyano-7-deazaguanine reductase QueF
MQDNNQSGDRFDVLETGRTGEITHRLHGVSAICPVDNEDFVDDYTVEVSYLIRGYVIEVGSLKNWMDEEFRDQGYLHIELLHQIGEAIIEEMPDFDSLMISAETNQYRGVDNEIVVNEGDLRSDPLEGQKTLEDLMQ